MPSRLPHKPNHVLPVLFTIRWVGSLLVASLGITVIAAPGDDLRAAESTDPGKKQPPEEKSEAGSSLVQLLASWQACFTREKVTKRNAATIVAACDHAATFSIVHPTERRRIAYRRAKVLQAADEARGPDPE
jgi:hypothetical protein